MAYLRHAGALILIGLCAGAVIHGRSAARTASFKIAFYNIKSGFGQPALAGIPSTFADTPNCTNRAVPLNAWGVGVVQAELRRLASDPAVVALGLAEAWTCATPGAVRSVLGWNAVSSERNGVAMVARYGFAGPEQWTQLDTSRNPSPLDTMWVLRVPVCLDAGCSNTMTVFTAHWFSTGLGTPDVVAVYEKQARQTVAFMGLLPASEPRVLVGDLNVFSGTEIVCDQTPKNSAIGILADAGYLDAWRLTNPADPGFTGMWNRAGCGVPIGGLWKRIDYGWSRNLSPVSMTRFGMVEPGHAAPSDHAGIVVEYPMPGAGGEPPFGSFDTPLQGTTGVNGTIGVTGWALDDLGVARVRILRDPVGAEPPGQLVYVGDASLVDGARPDVAAANAALPLNTRAGWGYAMLTQLLPSRGNGVFTLYAYADDVEGHSTLLGARTITCDNGTAVAPFGAIDTPAQGAVVSGVINNFGWVLSPAARRADPPGGGRVLVVVDGTVVGSPGGWTQRSDLTAIFPALQYGGVSSAAGVFTLDTRRLANGVHTIAWLVTDNHGTTSGIGSRYFTVAN